MESLAVLALIAGLVLGFILGLLIGIVVCRCCRPRRARRRRPTPTPGPVPDVPADSVRRVAADVAQRQAGSPFALRPVVGQQAQMGAESDPLQLRDRVWFGDDSPDRELADAIAHLHDEDRTTYFSVIERLRGMADAAAQAVSDIEERLNRDGVDAYSLRWALYYILGDLESVATLPRLTERAVAELPTLDPDSSECEGPWDGAILVSVTAVEGMSRLLGISESRERAADGLSAIVGDAHVDEAVRRAAARALLGNDDLGPAFRNQLPQELSDLLTERRITADDDPLQVNFEGGSSQTIVAQPPPPAP
jgi:hypothetical protein